MDRNMKSMCHHIGIEFKKVLPLLHRVNRTVLSLSFFLSLTVFCSDGEPQETIQCSYIGNL